MTDDTHKLTAGRPLRVAAPPRGTGSAVNASMNRKGWISKWASGSNSWEFRQVGEFDRNALPVFPRQGGVALRAGRPASRQGE